MKAFIIILSLLTSCASWARGPVDPISPPWPLSISTLPVDLIYLPGEWVAYDHNSIWWIQITFNKEKNGLSEIYIRSNAVRNHEAAGWLVGQKNALVGQLVFNNERAVNIMIFRDKEGTKLRIAAESETYYDLKLFKK